MVDPSSGGRCSPPSTTAAKRRRRPRARLSARAALTSLALAAAMLAAVAASAFAEGPVTLPGGPLVVSVGALGQCQSNYPNVGNNFYTTNGALGDCGFFLAFPAAKNPASLKGEGKGTVWGFTGSAGPRIPLDGEEQGGMEYTEDGQGPVTGNGTSGAPYSETTKFKVMSEAKQIAIVTDTTTYIDGEAQFTSSYAVQNMSGATLYFHAIAAGDLYTSNDDHGTGVFLGGPPRFVGGQNPHTGTLGGFVEVPGSSWSNWQEGYWDGPFLRSRNPRRPRDLERRAQSGDRTFGVQQHG